MTAIVECDRCGKFFDPSDEIVVILSMDYSELDRGDSETRDLEWVFHRACFNEAASNDFGLKLLPRGGEEP